MRSNDDAALSPMKFSDQILITENEDSGND